MNKLAMFRMLLIISFMFVGCSDKTNKKNCESCYVEGQQPIDHPLFGRGWKK